VLRELFFGIAFPVAFLWSLLSAKVAVLVLNWIWFQRPYEFSWGFWNTQPLFTLAVGITIVSAIIHRQFKPRVTPLLGIYLFLLFWLTLSAAFAYDTRHAWDFYKIFMPSMWLAPVLMVATIHDLKLLKLVFWVAAGGLGLNAMKVGLSLTLAGGGHLNTYQPGFVGDNNVFALVVCMVVAILIGLRSTLPKHWLVRAAFWAALGAALLCIVYTRSRGAYVALGAIFLVGSMLGPRPFRHSIAVIVVAIAGYWVLPDENFERLQTLRDVRADDSAMGRVENWKLAWDMTLAHPLLGVGMDNHIPYNREVVRPEVQVRVAHNVYFQALEGGFPALMLYVAFLVGAMVSLFNTWRFARRWEGRHRDAQWVSNLAFWSFCAAVGYAVGASFLNTLYIEFPWMAMIYGSLLGPMFRRQLQSDGLLPSPQSLASTTTAGDTGAAPAGQALR
jgi:probable O-glycosylation ligase (exosortase A-associated)